MTRSKDPFSDIKLSDEVGLDQRLFQQGDGGTTRQRDSETTEQRNNVTTGQRASAGAGQRDNAGARKRGGEAARARAGAAASERVRARTKKPTTAAAIAIASERAVERHTHDIFFDQVRWMNRTKLELEEMYGKRVTSNEIVKLALDLLIDDFKRRGESSKLFRGLILGERIAERTDRGPGEAGEEGEDG